MFFNTICSVNFWLHDLDFMAKNTAMREFVYYSDGHNGGKYFRTTTQH